MRRRSQRITAIINEKGGTGKTTTADALAYGLSRREKVLSIDLDPQCNLSAVRGELEIKGPTIYDVLTGETTITSAVRRGEGGDFIAGSRNLAALSPPTGYLTDAIRELPGHYDFIVIDCPPTLGALSICALTAATDIIIPVTPDVFALQALANIRETVKAVRRHGNPDLKIAGILFTRYTGRTNITQEMSEVFAGAAAELGTKVYKARIRECTAIREAQALRQNILTFTRSNGAQDYDQFITEYKAEG